MKRILRFLGSLLGLLALAALGIVLVTTFRGLRRAPQSASPMFQSPIETPTPPHATPTPLRATSTPQRGILATLPSMMAKATVAALGAKHTPRPRPLHPIRSPQDVVNIVLNDPEFKANLNDPIFGPHSKDAIPGSPIHVKLVSEKYHGQYYYIVPFYTKNHVTGLATVWIENGMGAMGMWSNADAAEFPIVTAAEAINLIEAKGYHVAGEPELVFRPTIEGGLGWTDPFWEVNTKEGVKLYVMHILDATKVYRSDEVHPID